MPNNDEISPEEEAFIKAHGFHPDCVNEEGLPIIGLPGSPGFYQKQYETSHAKYLLIYNSNYSLFKAAITDSHPNGEPVLLNSVEKGLITAMNLGTKCTLI